MDLLPPQGPTDISAGPFAKHIRLLAVHGVIANQQLLVRHAQRDAQDVLDKAHDQARPHDVPANDEHGTCNLVADLDAVPGDSAAGVCERERLAAGDCGEDTRGASADDPGDEMGVENTQDVIDGAHERNFFAEYVHGEPRDGARPEAHGDGTPARDDAGGGRDGDKTADHAVDGADDGGLAVVQDVAEHPAEHAHRGANVGVEHGDARVHAGGVGVAAVEAVPAEPEDARPDEDGADVVGPVVFAVRVEAGADPPGAHEARRAGGEVDDVAPGVVDDAEDGEKAAAPDGVGDDTVGEGEPEGHVDGPGEEVHAAEEGAGGDDEGDGREDELEVHHDGHGEVCADARGRQQGLRKLVLHGEGRARDPREGQHVLPERDLVAPDDPADEDGAEGVEGHEGGVDGPFALDDAGVQDHEARHRLQPHEGGGGHLPGIVALVEPVGLGGHGFGRVGI